MQMSSLLTLNKCPKRKILNPKTGRYIIDRNKKNENEECPKGSYFKSSTKRCNKIETSSKIKKK